MNLKKLVNEILCKVGYQFIKLSSVQENKKTLSDYKGALAMLTSQDQLLAENLEQISLLTRQLKPSTSKKVIVKDSRPDNSVDLRMRALKNSGFSPSIFVGCYDCDGSWAKKVSEVFKGVKVTLLEPSKSNLEQVHSNITEFSDDLKTLNIELCDIEEQIGQSKNAGDKNAAVPLSDSLAQKKQLDSVCQEEDIVPDLIRFDSRAIESGALGGAAKSLRQAEVCILSYNFDNSGLLNKLVSNSLSSHGYVFYDIWGLNYREYDHRLNECDFIFVKSDSTLLDRC